MTRPAHKAVRIREAKAGLRRLSRATKQAPMTRRDIFPDTHGLPGWDSWQNKFLVHASHAGLVGMSGLRTKRVYWPIDARTVHDTADSSDEVARLLWPGEGLDMPVDDVPEAPNEPPGSVPPAPPTEDTAETIAQAFGLVPGPEPDSKSGPKTDPEPDPDTSTAVATLLRLSMAQIENLVYIREQNARIGDQNTRIEKLLTELLAEWRGSK